MYIAGIPSEDQLLDQQTNSMDGWNERETQNWHTAAEKVCAIN
jgi:hypothetical protein